LEIRVFGYGKMGDLHLVVDAHLADQSDDGGHLIVGKVFKG